jgi:hypothetical protein
MQTLFGPQDVMTTMTSTQPAALNPLPLGPSASALAVDKKLALETMVSLPNEIWTPSACPLCVRGVPLEMLSG